MFLSFFQFYVKWRCKGTRTSFRKQFIGTTDSCSSLTTTSSLELVMEEAGQVGGRRALEGATSTSSMAVETSTSRPVGQPPPSLPHPKIGPQTKEESRPNTSKAKGKRHMFEFHTFWHAQTRILLLWRESAIF